MNNPNILSQNYSCFFIETSEDLDTSEEKRIEKIFSEEEKYKYASDYGKFIEYLSKTFGRHQKSPIYFTRTYRAKNRTCFQNRKLLESLQDDKEKAVLMAHILKLSDHSDMILNRLAIRAEKISKNELS